MSTNPEPWHAPLEIALQADLGEVEALRTRWYPLPPSDDWMVIVDDAAGRRRGILFTQLFTPITSTLFDIIREERSADDRIWLAVPADAELASADDLDLSVIRCAPPHWLPQV